MERYPERRRGHHPGPKQPLQGRHQVHTADVPTGLPGAARCQGQDPQTFLGLRLCPLGQEGLGQSDSQGASGHQGLCTATWEVCAPSVLRAEDGRVLGHLLPSPHPHACVAGAQRACGAFSVPLEGMSGHQALVLCPRLQIRETTKEPTPMETPEGFFTSWSLGVISPNTAEQGRGSRD